MEQISANTELPKQYVDGEMEVGFTGTEILNWFFPIKSVTSMGQEGQVGEGVGEGGGGHMVERNASV